MEVEKTDWNQRYINKDTPWDSGTRSELLVQFLKQGWVKAGRALELGCGTGTNSIFLAQSGFQVTAVDLSEEALRQARVKAEQARVSINFIQADITALPDIGAPFPFVFDRGTYHIVRNINLKAIQAMLCRIIAPGGLYFVLAGNANEYPMPEKGPPRVTASDMCAELESDAFDLVRLEEDHFQGIMIDRKDFSPLCWSAIFRRRSKAR